MALPLIPNSWRDSVLALRNPPSLAIPFSFFSPPNTGNVYVPDLDKPPSVPKIPLDLDETLINEAPGSKVLKLEAGNAPDGKEETDCFLELVVKTSEEPETIFPGDTKPLDVAVPNGRGILLDSDAAVVCLTADDEGSKKGFVNVGLSPLFPSLFAIFLQLPWP